MAWHGMGVVCVCVCVNRSPFGKGKHGMGAMYLTTFPLVGLHGLHLDSWQWIPKFWD